MNMDKVREDMEAMKKLLGANGVPEESWEPPDYPAGDEPGDIFTPITPTNVGFLVKDSGERKQFDSGMVRDTTTGKTDYTLVMDGPMFKRWAEHLTKGAIKYNKRNWMKAEGEAELERFRESAVRHFIQWLYGEKDEDHAAAVFFNINGFEYVKEKMV